MSDFSNYTMKCYSTVTQCTIVSSIFRFIFMLSMFSMFCCKVAFFFEAMLQRLEVENPELARQLKQDSFSELRVEVVRSLSNLLIFGALVAINI